MQKIVMALVFLIILIGFLYYTKTTGKNVVKSDKEDLLTGLSAVDDFETNV